jgi:hypothetical protein
MQIQTVKAWNRRAREPSFTGGNLERRKVRGLGDHLHRGENNQPSHGGAHQGRLPIADAGTNRGDFVTAKKALVEVFLRFGFESLHSKDIESVCRFLHVRSAIRTYELVLEKKL